MKNDPFKFFVPIELEKAQEDSQGRKVMKVSGVASTSDQDTDQEFLDPNGFDLSYFNEWGFINWNHQAKQKPTAVIDEPTKALIQNDELYVEGKLYSDSPLAQDVYQLGQLLAKSGSNRQLGFSIEGQVLEKDPDDERVVKKARITGLAITPSPKNPKTFANFVKGHDVEESEEEEDDIIVDVTDPETGDRITVDKMMKVKKQKALAANSSSGQALALESVDGSTKNTVRKANVAKTLLNACDGDEQLAKSIYQSINLIEDNIMSVDRKKVDSFLADLGLNIQEGKVIEKANKDQMGTGEEANGGKESMASQISKMCKSIGGLGDKISKMSDENMSKMMGSMKSMMKTYDSMMKSMEDDEMDDKSMKKGEDEIDDDIDQSNKKGMKKSNENSFTREDVEEIVKSLIVKPIEQPSETSDDALSKSIADTLEKSMSNLVDSINKRFDSMDERMKGIEDTPILPKSVKGGAPIEKSFGGGNGSLAGSNKHYVMSLTKDKGKLLELLEKGAQWQEDGTPKNIEYATAAMALENGAPLDKSLVKSFAEEGLQLVG